MADPFIGEIRMFGGNFAPRGFAFCNGQLLPIAQNTALFSLLGTMYGGDGRTNFGLPDLQGRLPTHPKSGYPQGAKDGDGTVILTESQIASHSHTIRASPDVADLKPPAPGRVLARSSGGSAYQSNTSANLVPMHPSAIGATGGGQPHNNLQPYLVINFIIALTGLFPPRS